MRNWWKRRTWERTKISASTQIGRRVDLLLPAKWRGKKVGVSFGDDILGGWAGAVTTIAASYRVNPIASQTYEIPILVLQVKVNRGDGQAAMNPCLFTFVTISTFMGSDEPRTAHHSGGNNRRECYDDSLSLQRPLLYHGAPPHLGVTSVIEIGGKLFRMA
jgi:hypothetical protein